MAAEWARTVGSKFGCPQPPADLLRRLHTPSLLQRVCELAGAVLRRPATDFQPPGALGGAWPSALFLGAFAPVSAL